MLHYWYVVHLDLRQYKRICKRKISLTSSMQNFTLHAYVYWERSLNKNTSGFIRQYFSKASDSTAITQEEINIAMYRLYTRPKKYPDITIPNKIFAGINPSVVLAS